MSETLIQINVEGLNKRAKSAQSLDDDTSWIKELFKLGEIQFILTYGAGYLLTLTTEVSHSTEDQAPRNELQVFVNNELENDRPITDLGEADETLKLGVAQKQAMQRIFEFLRHEHAAGRRVFSIAAHQTFTGSSEGTGEILPTLDQAANLSN